MRKVRLLHAERRARRRCRKVAYDGVPSEDVGANGRRVLGMCVCGVFGEGKGGVDCCGGGGGHEVVVMQGEGEGWTGSIFAAMRLYV